MKNNSQLYKSITEALDSHAVENGSKLAFEFIGKTDMECTTLTFEELRNRSLYTAGYLQTKPVYPKVAILLYPQGLEFISAFMACLYAGVIAVPVHIPNAKQGLTFLKNIIADSGATMICTNENTKNYMSDQVDSDQFGLVEWIATDSIKEQYEYKPNLVNFDGSSIAFLQYTSGSTGFPKGVIVSQENIVKNEMMIQDAFSNSFDDRFVTWLPMFHDMGLLGGVLQPIFVGMSSYVFSPLDFIQKPFRWLEAISKYKATKSGAPNFAYQLCVDKVTEEQMAQIDLSSWHVAFNGAEPINAKTLEAFANKFETCGFKRRALFPCYGMAETTLFVSGGPAEAIPDLISVDSDQLINNTIELVEKGDFNSQELVGCGIVWHDQAVSIVDPVSCKRLGCMQVGEIWLKGANITQGYWSQPEQTNYAFKAQTQDGKGDYFRTGDLGFVRDRQLFVTGRIKDVIIIRGKNHYPQDLERTAESVDMSLRQGSSAAVVVEQDGITTLNTIHEVKRDSLDEFDPDKVSKQIIKKIAKHHAVTVGKVTFIQHGTIPKTTSGKIRRSACRDALLSDGFKLIL
jgi:acyl-CoA synthetase (AMP-forming)/AMP-acid ligase II